MKEFIAMRKLAADKRDKAYKKARNEYETALVRIAELEQMICGEVAPGHLKVSTAIERVIPKDRPFTVADIAASLAALDPDRNWRRRSIDNHLFRMRERGTVKRLRKNGVK